MGVAFFHPTLELFPVLQKVHQEQFRQFAWIHLALKSPQVDHGSLKLDIHASVPRARSLSSGQEVHSGSTMNVEDIHSPPVSKLEINSRVSL